MHFFRARKDALLPLSKPIKGIDGKELHELFVPGNTNIIVGIMAANQNPEIWGSDAYEWKPSRWLEALPETVSSARIPGVYSHLYVVLSSKNDQVTESVFYFQDDLWRWRKSLPVSSSIIYRSTHADSLC